MAVAKKLQSYLDNHGIDYEVLPHPHSHSSMETAEVAHIPGAHLAKAVIVNDDDSYLMVVIPSTEHVALGVLHKQLNRQVGLATEAELKGLFPDCEIGAIPALGDAYGVKTLWDSALAEAPDIYFEGGDHENVVRISRDGLQPLLAQVEQGEFSCHR